MVATKTCHIVGKLKNSLDKQIVHKEVEQWARLFWSSVKKKKAEGPSFHMVLPPPNVTGNLHLGHALTAAVQDSLVRHRRMLGANVKWAPGFDHAGLATQSIIEKQFTLREGRAPNPKDTHRLTNLAHRWTALKTKEMKQQLSVLGLDLDYDHEFFTMDEHSSLAVKTAFKQLFDQGLVYRAAKKVYWSDFLQTTLSDIEVEKVDGIARYSRTGEIVERKELKQWFVDTSKMARRAVEVVNDGSVDILPKNYVNSWSAWLVDNGVQDWCISRQAWWGHRIPAYKVSSSDDVNVSWVVSDSLCDAAMKLDAEEDDIIQDPDVLDTWFSSSLLPLSISGWPDRELFSESLRSERFPLSIMETGFDILNYWVSKMVMMSLALTNEIPFKTVLLHGMICDSEGKKMSKSKGNVIDPMDVINGTTLHNLQMQTKDMCKSGLIEEKHLEEVLKNQAKLFPKGIPDCGSDGLRSYLLSHDYQEEVVRVNVLQMDKMRRLTNKIWNVYRFYFKLIGSLPDEVKQKCSPMNLDPLVRPEQNQEFFDKLQQCVQVAEDCFMHSYQLHPFIKAIEDLWCNQLSSKFIGCHHSILLKDEVSDRRISLIRLMGLYLDVATRLSHPIMPHLTEFMHQKTLVTCNPSLEIDDLISISNKRYPKLDIRGRYELN